MNLIALWLEKFAIRCTQCGSWKVETQIVAAEDPRDTQLWGWKRWICKRCGRLLNSREIPY